MLTRKHFLVFLGITVILMIGVFVGREVRSMKNFEAPESMPVIVGGDFNSVTDADVGELDAIFA